MPKNAPHRLNHFTPLRYPGGKAKLAPFIKALLAENDLEDGWYIEPFAGGAGIAVQLLLQGYVSRIAINDVSLPVYAFWYALTTEPQRLSDTILTIELSVAEWDRQKGVLRKADPSNLFELGLSVFYLNRTNRSGVLNGGIIGGRAQAGNWLIDARFNRIELAYRVRRLGELAKQIEVSCLDAVEFLSNIKKRAPKNKSLIYADPPYYEKGRQLYLDYYISEDHLEFANFMKSNLMNHYWMVSYDDVPAIRKMYSEQRTTSYSIPYSVRSARLGSEVMFYSPSLKIPSDAAGQSELGPADRFLPA